MEHLSLLIKPASSLCNMKCKYCFYHSLADKRDNKSYGIMQSDTVIRIIENAFKYANKSVSFAFQGGEPTLAGREFFKFFLDNVNKLNINKIKVFFSIQTNGYNISEDFAEFFYKNNFLVGLSVDGYKEIHDYLRVDSSLNTTHNKVLKTAALFKKYNVEFNILTVVTAYTAKHIDKIYRFFKKNNFKYLQFIPCLDPLESEPLGFPHSLTSKLYEDFLIKLFKLYYEDFMGGNYISIRFFDNLVRVASGGMSEQCGMLGYCRGQFVIEADGTVFPCDFYCVDNWKLGNINELSFEELYISDRMQEFIKTSIYDKEKCESCDVYNLCKGGCRRDRDPSSFGLAKENIYCEALYNFYTYAKPFLIAINGKLNSKY